MSNKLKYEKEKYMNSGLYDGEFGDEEIACYKEKLVKCRKQHTCSSCQKEIPAGDYALSENGFMDGNAVSSYTCTNCIEEWLEESGQVETDEQD